MIKEKILKSMSLIRIYMLPTMLVAKNNLEKIKRRKMNVYICVKHIHDFIHKFVPSYNIISLNLIVISQIKKNVQKKKKK